MSSTAQSNYVRFSQLLANVKSLRKRIETIHTSDPELGEAWKVGMLRHWGQMLMEAVDRAKDYAAELGLDPDIVTENGC